MSNQGAMLPGRAREIVCNVDKYFEREKEQCNELLNQMKTVAMTSWPHGDIILSREMYANIMQTLKNAVKVGERVHLATGINKNTLTRIRRECKDAEASNSKMTTPKKTGRKKKVKVKEEKEHGDNFEIVFCN